MFINFLAKKHLNFAEACLGGGSGIKNSKSFAEHINFSG